MIHDGGSERKIQSEESVSEEQRVIEPKEPIPPRRSTRISHPLERYMDMLEEDVEKIFLVDDVDHIDDFKIYDETISDIDFKKWLEAMKSEIDSMHFNQVWSLVDLTEGIISIGYKWIYKRKIGSDGKVQTYKAKLIMKGYSQREGIDYHEIFSPVAMLKSIYTLLAIAAFHDYKI